MGKLKILLTSLAKVGEVLEEMVQIPGHGLEILLIASLTKVSGLISGTVASGKVCGETPQTTFAEALLRNSSKTPYKLLVLSKM